MTEETLFAAALEQPDPAAYLAAHCPDPAVRRRVEELLAAHAAAGSFLNHPAAAPDVTTALPPADPGATRSQVSTDPDATADPRTGPADPDEALAFLKPPGRPGSLGRLAHYEVLEVLGSGGFGTVLKAFDDRLHRAVAVKVLAPQLAASGAARSRFEREARSAAAVRDEHVVNVYAVSEPGDPLPYLVMELVVGQTLQAKIDKVGPLPPKEVLRVGAQIARGLAAAHKQGLIHRDIKPANILLENGVERVKVTDFGLARAADDASLSQSGVVAGTPMYMSPEQARGDTLDTRSDLFSLGSVLYVLCTGRPPFRAETTFAVLKRVIEDEPRPVREVNAEVPRWLADVVAKLHAKTPADRFQTAAEVAELLAGYLAELQQQGTVVSRVAAPGRKAAPCSWWWFTVPLVLFGLLSAAAVLADTETDGMPRRDAHVSLAYGFGFIAGVGLVAAAALSAVSPRWAKRLGSFAVAAATAAATSGGLAVVTPAPTGEVAVIPVRGLVAVLPHRDGQPVGDWIDVSNGYTLRLPVGRYTLEPRFAPGAAVAFWDVTTHRADGPTTARLEARVAEFDLAPGGRVAVRAGANPEPPPTPPPALGPPIPPSPPAWGPPPAVAPFTAAQAKAHQEAWAKHLRVPVEVENDLGMKLRLVPPGEFTMGCSTKEVEDVIGLYPKFEWTHHFLRAEAPQRRVTIGRPFYAGTTEVTSGQFRRFSEALKYKTEAEVTAGRPPGQEWTNRTITPTDAHPVVFVSITDARSFCKWLGAQDGLEYRLPTEEEWEFAARAGTTTRWFCGDDPSAVGRYAWFNGKNNPVGTKLPNPFGLFDIHSNVIEFTLGRDGIVVDRSGVSNFSVWFARSGSRAERRGSPDLQAGFRVVAVGDLTPAAKLETRRPPP